VTREQACTTPTTPAMPSRGRHQSTSKECREAIRRIEALDGVIGVIIGMSYGGKSLGKGMTTGSIRIQREISGGLKGVTQTEKGLQEIFIRTEEGAEQGISATVRSWQ
jgi:2-keto-3-deoxy-L-rhamnonate aldolase RhmA